MDDLRKAVIEFMGKEFDAKDIVKYRVYSMYPSQFTEDELPKEYIDMRDKIQRFEDEYKAK